MGGRLIASREELIGMILAGSRLGIGVRVAGHLNDEPMLVPLVSDDPVMLRIGDNEQSFECWMRGRDRRLSIPKLPIPPEVKRRRNLLLGALRDR